MRLLVIFLVISLVFVSGCVGSEAANSNNNANSNSSDAENAAADEDTSALKTFDMTVGHTFMSPSVLRVRQGDSVKILVKTSPGTEDHNHGISIDEYGINVANTDSSNPTVVEFVADKKGEFTIYCKTCWDGPFGRNHPDIRSKLIVE